MTRCARAGTQSARSGPTGRGIVDREGGGQVPTTLHTPLMSGTNAIHGIVIVGALLVAGAEKSTLTTVLGTIAVAFSTINVVGGFLVTDRMLEMFKRRPEHRDDG